MSSRATIRERVDERLRLMQIYDTFMRYGSDAIFDRGVVGDVRRALQSRLWGVEVEPLAAPVKVRLLLQELGPTYVKLGQIISSRAQALPIEWEQELARLQSDVQPFPGDEAIALVEAELGAPVNELYASFDPRPLAAASLGQVHRATLHGGREVVVKVQRPDIEPHVKADLRILSSAAGIFERRSAVAHEAALQRVVEEFGGTLMLELDYRLEAYNARRLQQILGGIEGVRVPEVMSELSTRRVLTMEFIRGVEANRREEIIAAGLDPIAVADNAVRAAIQMVLIEGFFHADPHPGNVKVDTETGELVFLDAGMVGELSLRHRANLVGLLYTTTQGDPRALAQSLRSISEPFRADVDPKAFDADFARRVGPLLDVAEGEKLQLADIIAQGLDLLRAAGYRPDPQLTLAMKALTQSSEFMVVLYPPGHAGDFGGKAVEMARELAQEHLTEERITGFAKQQAMYAAREAAQQLPSLQEATNLWLNQYRKGRFEVHVDTSDLEPRIESLARMTRTATLGLVVVGVLIASAIAANAPETGTFDDLREVAKIGYAVALALAGILVVVLAWQALRRERRPTSGELARRPRR
ncbi:MAG: AarF/UbiB family protein [Solirubrobacteraceae bacterium]|jgi:ubiquinone biosynthesis protein|nr:AarF/UbiB family protein [Solirubrobacteraceae bacterium]